MPHISAIYCKSKSSTLNLFFSIMPTLSIFNRVSKPAGKRRSRAARINETGRSGRRKKPFSPRPKFELFTKKNPLQSTIPEDFWSE